MTLIRYSYTISSNQQNFYSYMYVFMQYDTKQLRNLVVRVRSLWNGCECLRLLTVSLSRRSGSRWWRIELLGRTCLLKNLSVRTSLLSFSVSTPEMIIRVLRFQWSYLSSTHSFRVHFWTQDHEIRLQETRNILLSCVANSRRYLEPFRHDSLVRQTDRQTEGQTDRQT